MNLETSSSLTTGRTPTAGQRIPNLKSLKRREQTHVFFREMLEVCFGYVADIRPQKFPLSAFSDHIFRAYLWGDFTLQIM